MLQTASELFFFFCCSFIWIILMNFLFFIFYPNLLTDYSLSIWAGF